MKKTNLPNTILHWMWLEMDFLAELMTERSSTSFGRSFAQFPDIFVVLFIFFIWFFKRAHQQLYEVRSLQHNKFMQLIYFKSSVLCI